MYSPEVIADIIKHYGCLKTMCPDADYLANLRPYCQPQFCEYCHGKQRDPVDCLFGRHLTRPELVREVQSVMGMIGPDSSFANYSDVDLQNKLAYSTLIRMCQRYM